VLINNDLQQTFEDLVAVLTAERRRAVRQKPAIEAFVERLLKEK
jgi:guanylate kinase